MCTGVGVRRLWNRDSRGKALRCLFLGDIPNRLLILTSKQYRLAVAREEELSCRPWSPTIKDVLFQRKGSIRARMPHSHHCFALLLSVLKIDVPCT